MLKVFLSVFFLLFISFKSYSQVKSADKQITVTFKSKPLVLALQEIERLSGFTFSYNSNIIPENKLISYSCTDRYVSDILDDILSFGLSYDFLGTQILLYKNTKPDSNKDISANTEISEDNRKLHKPIRTVIYDTLRVIDTVLYIDTVYKKLFDTVKVYDTVKTIIEQTYIMPQKVKYVLSNQYVLGNISSSPLFRLCEMQIAAIFPVNKFNISSGLSLSQFTDIQKYSYKTYTVDSSKFEYKYFWYWDYKLVTDFKYVTDSGDTLIYSHYDSLYVKDSISDYYNRIDTVNSFFKNSFTYLRIPLYLSYSFQINNKFEVTPQLGFIMGFLLNSNRDNYYNSKQNQLKKDDLNMFLLSLNVSVQFQYNFSKHFSIYLQPIINRNLNSIYKSNIPLQPIKSYFSLGIGVVYKP
ncbi:MAG: hypothetical protein IPO21_18650 [Bacteroidales bacterium]|nr:hypothetical protein [Bacteroidales bacterium]